MSSLYIREKIFEFIEDFSDETQVVDLTAQFGELKTLLSELDFQVDSPWLGVQFVGDDEIPVALAATNDQGKYRESGAVFLHVVEVAMIGVGQNMLERGEALRNLFRGRRIGNIIIESVTPVNTDSGSTLQFESGYMAGTIAISYICDVDL